MKHKGNVRKTLVLLFIVMLNPNTSKALLNESYMLFQDPFLSFAELFGELEPVQPTKNRTTLEKDLLSQAKKLQDHAKKLSAAADELVATIEKKSDQPTTEKVLRTVYESQTTTSEAVQLISRSVRHLERAHRAELFDKTPKFSLNTYTQDNGETFVVQASLPDVEQEDLNISVKTTNEAGKEKQTLHVSTQQKTPRATATTEDFLSSSSFNSARFFNGRREELNVNDGIVFLAVDLPTEINGDLSLAEKAMSFEDNVLKLVFPIHKKNEKKETVLRFSNKPAVKKQIDNAPAIK